jgi:nucleoporin GLE1
MRSQILELEANLVNENEKFASILARVDKYREKKREMDRKFDMQYQRRM